MGTQRHSVINGLGLHEECERQIAGLTRRADGLETAIEQIKHQKTKLEEDLKTAHTENSGLVTEIGVLTADLAMFTDGLENREDEYARGIIRQNRVKKLEEISRSYEHAISTAGLDIAGDVNAQIMQRLQREKVPYEQSQEYLEIKNEFEQAKAAIKRAESGDKFTDTRAASKVISQVGQQKKDYDSTRGSLEGLKAALAGKSVLYMMTAEQDTSNYKINVIIPIQNKQNMQDFSRLERDLIAHIHYQWNELRTKVKGTFQRTARQVTLPKSSAELVQYTFFIPRKSASVEELKQIEEQLADSIFRSQAQYSFGALGLRIDLETFTNTRGFEIPQSQEAYPSTAIQKIEPENPRAETRSVDNRQGDIRFFDARELNSRTAITREAPAIAGQMPPLKDVYQTIRQTYQHFPDVRTRYPDGGLCSCFRMLALKILAESQTPLNMGAIRESMAQQFPGPDYNTRRLQNQLAGTMTQLIKEGHIEAEGPDKKKTYKISEKYK